MSEAKEVEQSCEDKTELVTNDSVAMKEVEKGGIDKHTEDQEVTNESVAMNEVEKGGIDKHTEDQEAINDSVAMNEVEKGGSDKHTEDQEVINDSVVMNEVEKGGSDKHTEDPEGIIDLVAMNEVEKGGGDKHTEDQEGITDSVAMNEVEKGGSDGHTEDQEGITVSVAMNEVEKGGNDKHTEDQEVIEKDEMEVDVEEEDEETESDDEDNEQGQKPLPSSAELSNDGQKEVDVDISSGKKCDVNMTSPVDAAHENENMESGNGVPFENEKYDEKMDSPVDAAHDNENVESKNGVPIVNGGEHLLDSQVPNDALKSNSEQCQKPPAIDEKVNSENNSKGDNDVKLDVPDTLNHQSGDVETIARMDAEVAPVVQSSPFKVEHVKEEEMKSDSKNEEPMDAESGNPSNSFVFDTDTSGGGDSGTEDEQAAFLVELIKFHKERGLDFRPPKFYGDPLNLLRLWRSVLKLGGYDKVTACKYWRQVGESFKPPRTCTTVSWTFRIFYEKALLDYERYRTSRDGPGLLGSLSAENQVGDIQAPGPGRVRRDSAARAMQGWHSQRVLDNGEVSDPIIKDKNSLSMSKKEKPLKSLGGFLKRKKPSSTDTTVQTLQKLPKTQSDATIIDIGSPADWVKINVQVTRDCYEVYALVPGLLREEVRVQSDPAGRLVISGEPENPDNPWNVTPFKKVVSLPSRIDPHQTSAVVTLHGQLFVRVPFEQYD